MIFSRYLIVFLAGYQTFSQAASLRSGRRLVAEYKEFTKLLDKTYGGNCEVHVTGEGVTPIVPITYVYCYHPGGYATMIADGGDKDPSPKKLTVCGTGAGGEAACSAVEFTGNAKEDLKSAEALLKGREAHWTEYGWLVKSLNSTYEGSCRTYVAGLKNEPTTFVDCTRPGGAAYLVAKGDAATGLPRVALLEICSYGSEMKEKCHTVKFSGDEEKDKEEVSKLFRRSSSDGRRELAPGPIQLGSYPPPEATGGSEFDMIVQLLDSSYSGACQKENDNTTVVCASSKSIAQLVGVPNQSTSIQPDTLTVCVTSISCKAMNFTGNPTVDLPLAAQLIFENPSSSGKRGLAQGSDGSAILSTDFEILVEYLNGAYNNSCQRQLVDTTTTVVCKSTDSLALLVADGNLNPKPSSFTVCDLGDDMQPINCDLPIVLTGNATEDLPAVKNLVEGEV
jgi:hypothetical protein